MNKHLLGLIVFLSSFWAINDYCITVPLPQKHNLGVNINALDDWTRDRIFNDVFKAHRGFSNTPDTPWAGSSPTTDANGWPTQDFGTVVMADLQTNLGGTYKIRFNGQATITQIASGLTVQNKQYDATTNTTTADLVYPNTLPSTGHMILSFTNTQYSSTEKGVKNIQIMKPTLGFDAPMFSQHFLDHIAPFSTIRTMDLHKTNANTDSLWANRTLPNDAVQTGSGGVAWEYIVALANTAQKDLWINIPHKANDDYVQQLATLIKNSLNPSLKLYVEYSNEV